MSSKESGAVYPVVSRRSGGLSLGVDLFRGEWTCDFDCVYCEVAREDDDGPRGREEDGGSRRRARGFSAEGLGAELKAFLAGRAAKIAAGEAGVPELKDICVAGSGEPCLSPDLASALAEIAKARAAWPEAKRAAFVIITNASMLGDQGIAALLARYAAEEGLEVWAKLDAGSQARFREIDRSPYPLERILEGILGYSRGTPLRIQTMVSRWQGRDPDEDDYLDYQAALSGLISRGARILSVQLYTQARAPRESGSEGLGNDFLSGWASRLRKALGGIKVVAYGVEGEIGLGFGATL